MTRVRTQRIIASCVNQCYANQKKYPLVFCSSAILYIWRFLIMFHNYIYGTNLKLAILNVIMGDNATAISQTLMLRKVRPWKRQGKQDKVKVLSMFAGKLAFYTSIQFIILSCPNFFFYSL